jgi:hypothetical protein
VRHGTYKRICSKTLRHEQKENAVFRGVALKKTTLFSVQKSLSYTMHLMLAVMPIKCVLKVMEKALNAEKLNQQLRGGKTISF